MQQNYKRPFYQYPIIIGIIAFCVLLVVTQYLSFQKYQLNISIEKQNTIQELNRVTDQLQVNINNALSVTKTLVFLVENYGVPEDFSLIGARLMENNSSIDAVQLLKNGIITDMYPIKGNEMVIGHNVLEDTTRNKELFKAYERDELYFGGPFELLQGGLGIVGRYPIKGGEPYSFAAVVIELSTLLENSGIANDDPSENYKFQLSKTNPNTNQEEFFLEKFDLELSNQMVIIKIPRGEWKLYAAIKNTTRWDGVIQLFVLGLLLSFLGGYLFWYISKQPARLQRVVTEKIKLISTNEKRYKALVENSLDGVVILNPEGNATYASPTIFKILGYTEEEIKKLNLFDILHDEDKPFVAEELQYVMSNPGMTINGHISRIKHKDGSWRWIESSITNLLEDPDVRGIVDNFRDITHKKIAENRIIKEKDLSEAIINTLPGIFYLYTKDGRFLTWNENFETVSGYTASEIRNMKPTDFYAPENQEYISNRIQTVFEEGESFAETYLYTKDKEKIYYYFTGKSIIYEDEICLVGTGIDLSKRKQAEEELEKSEEQLLSIFNNTINSVILMDANGLITNWNATAEKMFGWKSEEVLNKPMHHFIMPEKYRALYFSGMEKYQKTGKVPVLKTNSELTAITKSKKVIDISLGVTTVKIRGKEFFIGFINDISQQKEAERQKEYEKSDREALINATEDLIWSVSKEITLISANEAFEKSFENYTGDSIKEGDYILSDELFETEYLNLWKEYYKKGLNGERFSVQTTVPPHENQAKKTVETSFSPIIVDRQLVGVACHARDISQRIKNEEEIKEYNEKLKTAQEIAQLGYWEYDYQTETLFWSEQVYKIWGQEKENENLLTKEMFYKSIHPDDLQNFMYNQKEAIAGLKPLDIEHRILLNGNTVKWVHQRGKIFKEENGQNIRFEGTVQDITVQKLANIELREQNHFITTAIDNLPVGIAVRNIKTGRFTLMNKNFTEIYGWSKRELRDVNSFFEKVYPDAAYREKITAQIFSDLASKDVNRMQWEGLQVTTKKGENRIINAKNIPLYDQDLMISSVVDVTEKAIAEEKLNKSNERYEYVTKATFDAIWDWDIEKDTIYWGEGFQTIFGIESTGTNLNFWSDRVHPDDLEQVNKSIQNAFDGFEKNWMYEYRFKKGSGEYAYVKDKGIILRNINRKAIRMLGAIQDITKMHQIQQLYQDLFHLSPFPVYVYDIETLEFMDVNNAAVEHYGYTKEAFLQLTLKNIRPKEDLPFLEKAIAKMKSQNLKRTHGSYRHQKKNGDIIQVYIQGNHLQYMGRECEIIVAYDVTEQKHQESEILAMNEKLRNLSAHLQTAREEERIYIAREIHDELGQQLTGIKLDVSWLKNKTAEIYPEGIERTERLVNNINLTINKVRKIATDLRPGVLDDLGLEAAFEWHIQNFYQQTGIVCTLQTKNTRSNYDKAINTSLYRIFQEALTNILRHAEATEIQVELFEEKEILVLIVQDNGKGITEVEKNNILSLGITGMKERATMLDGEFYLTNHKEGGTVLKVCIPLNNI